MGSEKMHVVSFNCASWSKTLTWMDRFPKICRGFSDWMERHEIDILCLQEVKTNRSKLVSESHKLATHTEGYDSFWSWARKPDCAGFNGVAVFARKGLTLSADRNPLGDPDLDSEGRCILTDHGKFVIINVYVPNTSGGLRAAFQLKFLRALESLVSRLREEKREIILLGDFNVCYRVEDCHWSSAMINVRQLLRDTPASRGTGSDELANMLDSLRMHWDRIRGLLKHNRSIKRVETRQGSKPVTKYRTVVRLEVAGAETTVNLGRVHSDKSVAEYPWNVEADAVVEPSGSITFRRFLPEESKEGTESVLLRAAESMRMQHLAECMTALLRHAHPPVCPAWNQPRFLKLFARTFGHPPSQPYAVSWMQDFLKRFQMVDSFPLIHPAAQDRFTVWDQYRSLRTLNIGSRIDFILLTPALAPQALPGCPLYGGVDSSDTSEREISPSARDPSPEDPDSSQSALRAATSFGRFTSAGFSGDGIPELTEPGFCSQFREPHTGMLYTPPHFSDHIPVTVLLQGLDTNPGHKLATDSRTRACQPHLTQSRLTSFLRVPSSSEPNHDESREKEKLETAVPQEPSQRTPREQAAEKRGQRKDPFRLAKGIPAVYDIPASPQKEKEEGENTSPPQLIPAKRRRGDLPCPQDAQPEPQDAEPEAKKIRSSPRGGGLIGKYFSTVPR